uniref:Nucleotide exchange factor Fes1 domain-containing protein n=1 Tax=Haptolina brevifila TaxID=156173 RepID=A0A7S2NGV3_9EUKA
MNDPATLSQLLQWSLANTDLDALHERAEAIRRGEAQPTPINMAATSAGVLSAEGNEGELPALGETGAASVKRPAAATRAELDALAQLHMPDMVSMMRGALALAVNESLDVDSREQALLDLEELAADVDNARDLHTIGGFPLVLALFASAEPPLQAASAWVVGSSVKHQREMQLHLLEQGAVPALLTLLQPNSTVEVRGKALFALAALLGNCPEAQAAFAQGGGSSTLISILSQPEGQPAAMRLVRKALVLVTDLVREQRMREEDPEAVSEVASVDLIGSWRDATELCSAVVQCFASEELDAQEKALQAADELLKAGLIQALAGSPADGSSCTARTVRGALQRYRERCEAFARDHALEQEDDVVGSGECGDMLPIAQVVDEQLALITATRHADEQL